MDSAEESAFLSVASIQLTYRDVTSKYAGNSAPIAPMSVFRSAAYAMIPSALRNLTRQRGEGWLATLKHLFVSLMRPEGATVMWHPGHAARNITEMAVARPMLRGPV